MKLLNEQLPGLLLVLAGTAIQVGCADGPLPYINSMNPMMRQQWEADEQYQPTLHRQLGEVRALEETAATMSGERQVHWSHELAHVLEHNKNPLLRRAAVGVLGRFSVPQAAAGLRIAQQDKDPSVRIAACQAWGQRAGDEAVEQLGQVIGSDTNLDVRLAAARELGEFSDPTAYAALGLALNDPDPALQYRAVESLRAASGRDYGNDLEAWQQFAQGADPGPEATPSIAERMRRWF